MSKITLSDLRKISGVLRRNAVPPKKILTEHEAIKRTEEDETGHVWVVGEEYYEIVAEQ